MNRVEIIRDVFGPGERASGARFRDEVARCSGCGFVVLSHGTSPRCFRAVGELVQRREVMSPRSVAMFSRSAKMRPKLEELVKAPCGGLYLAPLADLGARWFAGELF